MLSLDVLYTRDQIQQRVKGLAAAINLEFEGQPIIMLAVLKGACIFLSDLSRHISGECLFDFISVSSYGDNTYTSGYARVTSYIGRPMAGQNVILVEDILDTGLTLHRLKAEILALNPKAFKIAVLLDKPARRTHPVQVDYVGFTIPDKFVVGYGMDYAEQYRNLPDICTIKEVEVG